MASSLTGNMRLSYSSGKPDPMARDENERGRSNAGRSPKIASFDGVIKAHPLPWVLFERMALAIDANMVVTDARRASPRSMISCRRPTARLPSICRFPATRLSRRNAGRAEGDIAHRSCDSIYGPPSRE
jgi:hypothetical protein